MGLPLDPLVYREGEFSSDHLVCIDEHNPYFHMIRSSWGQKLRQVFESIEDPHWNGGSTAHPLRGADSRFETMRKITHPGERII